MQDLKLNYDDITIVPEAVPDICSRSQCIPYDEDGNLPIFASCMSSVVAIENTGNFNAAKIRTVIPRSYPLYVRTEFLEKNEGNFVAFSLNEAKEVFIDKSVQIMAMLSVRSSDEPLRICIDLANGHMKCLLDLVKEIKEKYGKSIVIMTGNIANPETYKYYEEAGVDYCRCTVGSGNVCSTASNTGIFYSVFSL